MFYKQEEENLCPQEKEGDPKGPGPGRKANARLPAEGVRISRVALIAFVFIVIMVSATSVNALANNVNLTFVDEDTNTILSPTVTVNGIAATVTNGTVDFNTNTARVDVNTSLSGYLDKSFSFGFPGDANIIFTAALLVDTNAQNIPFKLRTEAGALITDANLSVFDQNTGNLLGASIIGSDSLFNEVLKPAGKDYNFHVVGSGITDYNYSKQELVINNVIDESTLVDLGGIGTVTVSNPGSFIFGTLNPGDPELTDNFNGSDGDTPNAAIWFIYNDGATSNIVDLQNNDLNLFASGSNQVVGVKSDLNFQFNVGDVKEFEFTSVERPVGVGSEQYGAGLVVDNNANPQTAEIGFKINRGEAGDLTIYHGPNSISSQLDGGAGEKKFKIRITRTADTEYKSEYFIDDTNLMQTFTDTISHHLYKATLFIRSGSGIVTGKFDDASFKPLMGNTIFPFTRNFYSINVDFNNTYFTRTYKENLESIANLTISPYLVSTSDGVSTTIKTIKNSDVTTTVPDILVRTKKAIAGDVEVEAIITDDKGEALQSYIVGDTYILEFYNIAGTLLFVKDIEATSNTIFVYMETLTSDLTHTPQQSVTINFTPSFGNIGAVDGNNQITQAIVVENISVNNIRVFITNNDLNVYHQDFNVGVANGFTNTIDTNTLGGDGNFSYLLTVIVTLDNNTVALRFTTYSFAPADIDILGLVRNGVKTDIGCKSGQFCGTLALISLFLVLLILIGLKIAPVSGELLGVGGITIVGIILLSFFVYLEWFPFWLWALSGFVGIGLNIGIWKG